MNTDFTIMQHILNPNILKMKSKGIDSVKARVVNLKELNSNINSDILIENISESFCDKFGERAA